MVFAQIPANTRVTGSAKQFLAALSASAPDLEEVVEKVDLAKKDFDAGVQFSINPLTKLPDGRNRFSMHFSDEPETNLLDIFGNPLSAKEYAALEGRWLDTVDLTSQRHIATGYQGPKIILHPDTNILLNSSYHAFVLSLGRHPAIEKDVITIVRNETREGGLIRKNGRSFKPELLDARASLIKRSQFLSNDQKREASLLYDSAVSFFAKEARDIFRYSEKHRTESPETVGEIFVEDNPKPGCNEQAYARMIGKVVQKCREGNPNNLIVDRVLATTSFGLNLINSRDKSVVVSEDRDLISVFDAFYHDVLPRYMAKTVIEALRVRNPAYIRLPGYEDRTVSAAREQIEWATNSSPQNLTIGILYVPTAHTIHTKQVSEAFRQYFNNIEIYRHAKADLVAHMGLTGLSASRAVEELFSKKL